MLRQVCRLLQRPGVIATAISLGPKPLRQHLAHLDLASDLPGAVEYLVRASLQRSVNLQLLADMDHGAGQNMQFNLRRDYGALRFPRPAPRRAPGRGRPLRLRQGGSVVHAGTSSTVLRQSPAAWGCVGLRRAHPLADASHSRAVRIRQGKALCFIYSLPFNLVRISWQVIVMYGVTQCWFCNFMSHGWLIDCLPVHRFFQLSSAKGKCSPVIHVGC